MGGASPPQATWSSRGLGSMSSSPEEGQPGIPGWRAEKGSPSRGERAGSGGTGVGKRHQLPLRWGPSRRAGSLSQLRWGASESQDPVPWGRAALLQSLRPCPLLSSLLTVPSHLGSW